MNSTYFMLKKYKFPRTFSLDVYKLQRNNHYDCLGITPKATQGDVKNAYYKLSKQYHPDMNKDSESAAEKFRAITAAYEVLGNLKSRKLYDRGLIIGNSEECYQSEPQNYNVQHASFHKHRNKPSKQTVDSAHYDMDEWTRAHYSATFTNSFNLKRQYEKNVKVEEETSEEQKSQWLALFSFIFLVACAYLFHSTTSNNDRSSVHTRNENKTD